MPSKTSQRRTSFTNSWSQTGTEGTGGGSTTTNDALIWESIRNWNNTPNYRALRKSGAVIPPQNFDLSRAEWHGSINGSYQWNYVDMSHDPPEYRFFLRHGSGPFRTSMPFISASYDPPTLINDSELYSKTLERMRAQRFQAPVAFIEAAKTEKMIANRIVGLVSAARQLRRGNLSGFLNSLDLPSPTSRTKQRFNRDFGKDARKSAGNAWLEYQYGWKPFLSDAKTAAELLASTCSKPRNRVSTISVSIKRQNRFTIGDSSDFTPYDTASFDRPTTQDEQKRLKGRYLVRDELLNTASLLSLTNPLEVAWELVPFSFVADWFLPIGDFLSNMTALQGIDFQSYFIGTRIDYRYTCTNFKGPYAIYPYSSSAGGSGSYYLLKVSRRCFSGPPPNSFPSVVDFSKVFTSPTRIGNAVSLLSQQLSRFSR